MKVLIIFKENQLEIEGKNICPLNQQEIAGLVPCGKLKVNQIIKELVEVLQKLVVLVLQA